VVGTLGTLLVVVVAGTAGYAWYLNGEIHRLDVRGLVDVPVSGADAGTENILLVGSTDRCALKVQNAAYGLCSNGVTGVQVDAHDSRHLSLEVFSLAGAPKQEFVEGANVSHHRPPPSTRSTAPPGRKAIAIVTLPLCLVSSYIRNPAVIGALTPKTFCLKIFVFYEFKYMLTFT